MAFPKDSANMAIGGSGPVNKTLNYAQFHGVSADAYRDYSTSGAPTDYDVGGRPRLDERSQSFNPTLKAEPIHGDESMGLGTSTFLEGAPASRAAIEKHEVEIESMAPINGAAGGLGRKKSLAQRIRGISNSRPLGARVTSPEPAYSMQRQRTITPTTPPQAASAGGIGAVKGTESNPFFQDYDREYEKKGAKIATAEAGVGRSRAMSSPKRSGPVLERTRTNDSIGGGEAAKTGGGGLLQRVKSLKGGPRKTRPERREAS